MCEACKDEWASAVVPLLDENNQVAIDTDGARIQWQLCFSCMGKIQQLFNDITQGKIDLDDIHP